MLVTQGKEPLAPLLTGDSHVCTQRYVAYINEDKVKDN